MGLCSSSASVGTFDKVAQTELLSGKPILEFLGLKWDSKHAKQLLKPFDQACSNSQGIANVKRLITEALGLPFEKYYYEGFLVFGNHPEGGHPTGHEHCTFAQYVVSLWNICTLQRPHGIAEWMFRMEFGDERATKDDVFEMFDKQYGISEERGKLQKKKEGDSLPVFGGVLLLCKCFYLCGATCGVVVVVVVVLGEQRPVFYFVFCRLH